MEVGYAVLYTDGTLIISKNYTILSKKIEIDYGKFEETLVPWKNESKKIEKVQILDQVKSNYMIKWFEDCINLKTLIDFKNLDVSDCIYFSYVFLFCKSLQNIYELKNWNVFNGKNFQGMFFGCTSLQNLNILKNWNVSSGVNFSYMFYNCNSLQDLNGLENWNVSNGTNFSFMFGYCDSLQNIDALQNWNVSNCIDFFKMFEYCTSLQNILLPNTLSILRQDMFYECNQTLKIHWKKHIYAYEDLLTYVEIFY